MVQFIRTFKSIDYNSPYQQKPIYTHRLKVCKGRGTGHHLTGMGLPCLRRAVDDINLNRISHHHTIAWRKTTRPQVFLLSLKPDHIVLLLHMPQLGGQLTPNKIVITKLNGTKYCIYNDFKEKSVKQRNKNINVASIEYLYCKMVWKP